MVQTDAVFLAALKAYGIPAPIAEFVFCPGRRWRFDYAWWPEHRVALEVDGGIFIRGRHSRGPGMLKDMEKMNAAAVLGWRVLKTVPKNLTSPETLDAIAACLGLRRSA